jgi:hypothetical protein
MPTKLSDKEYEDLCDGCGACCEIESTGVACPYLDTITRRCTEYENRLELAPWCRKITPAMVPLLYKGKTLPVSCAYVRHRVDLPPLTGDEIPEVRLIPYKLAGPRVVALHNHILSVAKRGR